VTCNTPSRARTKFLTIFEVVAIVRVSKPIVYRLVHADSIRTIPVDGSFRIPEHGLTPSPIVRGRKGDT
jgi:hypothetical protein